MRRGRGALVAGVAALVAVAVAVVWLSEPAPPPFDPTSSGPDGYRALALLLEQRGVEVVRAPAGDVLDRPPPSGSVVVVPVWSYLDDDQHDGFESLARSGRRLVISGSGSFLTQDAGYLAHTPAAPLATGYCDLPSMQALEEIDDLVGARVSADGARRVCFGDASGVAVAEEPLGDGERVELSTPYLWANARLQPDKEQGGAPLDNAAMAVALLADAPTVTFVDAVPTPGLTPDGTRNPLELLPFGVKLALTQLVGAFLLYAWWRARRLGRPVREEMPVEVAGSELVEAVGGLLRRAGSPQRAAEVVRADTRRTLATRLGVPPDAGPDALVGLVASRTGRDPAEVATVVVSGPVGSAEELVRLARMLDTLRREVLDGQPVA